MQASVKTVAEWFGIPENRIDYTVGGINHLNFLLKLEHDGNEPYPQPKADADRIAAESESWKADTWQRERRGHERVRMEILKYLGYFVEYAIPVVHSLETGVEREVSANVYSDGSIDNLPARSVVEVPCTANLNGITGGRVSVL